MRTTSYLLALSALTLPLTGKASDSTDVDQHWDILLEWVYMLRTKGNNRKLVKDFRKPHCDGSCPSTVVLWTKHLRDDFGFQSGGRLGVSYIPDTKSSYEGRVMYLLPWEANKTIYDDASLSYPFHSSSFTEDYNTADEVKAHYRSHFYTVDINYWRNSARRGVDYFVVSGVFGLRFFEVKEKCSLAFYNDDFLGVLKSNYNTRARNDAIGIQGGFNFQMNPYDHFRFDLLALGGVGLNRETAYVLLRDQDNTVILRDYHSRGYHDIVFADAEAKLGYQVKPCFNIHAGYQLFYASGLSFAPSQYSTSTNLQSQRFYRRDPLLIHGILAGFNFDF